MKASEFSRWLQSARELGATHVEIRRARQNGGAASTVFLREKVEELDVERLVERMREDLSSRHRRLSKATFDALTFKVEEGAQVEVMRDAVVVARDDIEEPAAVVETNTVEGASVEMQRAAFAAAREAHRDLRDMAMGVCATLQGVAENLSTKLVESQEKVATVLQVAFEFSTLQREREQDAAASSERRELGKTAIQELAPLAGAALTHITKNATPAWAALAMRIQSSGKLPKLLELLGDDPEAVAALGSALGHTFPDKESEKPKEA